MAVDLQAKLLAAETAYHDLMVGRSVVELRDQNGELVRYTPASAQRLQVYVQSLRRQLGLPGSGTGPARAVF